MKNSDYSFSTFIGIDVAKNKFDIFEQKSQTLTVVGNNKHEISAWIKTLAETAQTIVIMETTGRYAVREGVRNEWHLSCSLTSDGSCRYALIADLNT